MSGGLMGWKSRWLLICCCVLQLVPSAVSELSNIPIKTHKYEYNGYGNNEENPTWGSAFGTRVRMVPDEDGFLQRPGVPRSEHTDAGLPSARRIMEELFQLPALKQKKASESTNDFKLNFGMLMSSDSIHPAGTNASEPFDLTGDGNFSDGVHCPVTGQFQPTLGYNKSFPRFQHRLVSDKDDEPVRATVNDVTAFLDLGCIYGTSEEANDEIRNPNDKRLFDLVDNGKGLLPRRPYIRSCFGIIPTGYAMHVLWMRLHNHVAEIISKENSGMDDEDVFQAARNYVIATYQKIALTKYVPSLLGDAMDPYSGYNASVDPSIDEYFAAITYRYGHSEQPNVVRLADEDFLPTSQDPILMRDAYHKNAQAIVERIGGIESVIRGAIVSPTKPFDYSFEVDLNFYSKATSMVDVQRARDVGIPPYNQARRNFGLEPVGSIRELVEGSANFTEELVNVMQNLYGNDIEKVDSYVGTLFEKPINDNGLFGPSLIMSAKDQINRIRTGDRFWYEKTFTEDEIAALPSMSDIVKLVCTGMDKFPETFFRVYRFGNEGISATDNGQSCEGGQKNQVGLLGGDVTVKWTIQKPSELDDATVKSTLELTLTANAKMEGAGFLGIGWRSQKMAGADIWFCTVDYGSFWQVQATENCDEQQTSPSMFSCCLASGANAKPQCRGSDDPRFYKLDVVSWCLSEDESSVTVNVLVCDDGQADGCFEIASNPDGTIDMIVSFNPKGQITHGFQRRTSTTVDLKAGILTAAEAGVADTGLIAYHGITMLAFWLVGAPIAIFIVRYMKTKSWRLAAHISIMGAVGGLTIPIVVGIESAVGASSDKTQEHSLVGIILTLFILPMFIAGRIRYLKLQGFSVSRRTADWAFLFHKFYGYGILIFAWWNCYTGLVRISPADAYLQIVVLSSFPFGYDIPIFGIFKNHIYWPYLSIVVCVFVLAETRRWLQNQKLRASQLREETTTIWNDQDDSPETHEDMERSRFLDLVRLGTPLCIIDGRVLDLTGFLGHHPGGSDMLMGVAGTDISREVRGLRAIEGYKHKHSFIAVRKMKSLVVAKLVEDVKDESLGLRSVARSAMETLKRTSHMIAPAMGLMKLAGGKSSVDVEQTEGVLNSKPEVRLFRRARIVYTTFITPSHEVTADNKPVVLLCLAAPKRPDFETPDGIVPSSAYKFRITNPWGTTFEAYYTPVKLRDAKKGDIDVSDDEEILQFLISLRPGGQLQKACLSWRAGKTLPVFGPTINPKVLEQISATLPNDTVILFAAGTGIAPMLQLIDLYSPKRVKETPHIFLIWLLKNPQHNYNEWIGLEDQVKVFKGKFRWAVLYSAPSTKSGTGMVGGAKQKQKKSNRRRYSTAKLGEMLSEDPNVFDKRLKEGVTLDESSRRGDESNRSVSERNGSIEVNDAFWSVYGNKCMRLKLNQEIVSGLLAATKAEVLHKGVDGTSSKTFKAASNKSLNESITEPQTGKKNMVAYVCGSPGFDDSVRNWLSNSDFPSEKITDFYSSPTFHI